MFISNILKQNKANKEIQSRIQKNIQNTAELVKTILPDELVAEDTQRITEALQKYEQQSQIQSQPKKQIITLAYPAKTLQEAELDYHKLVQEEETAFRKEYIQWNDRIYQAHQTVTGHEEISVVDEGGAAIATTQRVRIADNKPYYITPTQTVIKIGDTHYELQMRKTLNTETNKYEWERLGMDILERAEANDINMEDSCIAYEDKEKKLIDWETTINRIKQQGERLGYGKFHFLTCLQRILGQYDDDLFQTYKGETDPEKIANNLLAKYTALNKKKIFEDKLKSLKRLKGQSIRDVMGQADILTDRILQKCQDPQEKAFRKHQIMLDALKSFSSEENAKELVQALKGASLSGERANISELYQMVM